MVTTTSGRFSANKFASGAKFSKIGAQAGSSRLFLSSNQYPFAALKPHRRVDWSSVEYRLKAINKSNDGGKQVASDAGIGMRRLAKP